MATSTQTQINRLAPIQEDFLGNIYDSATALTGEGSQMPYSAQELAALSPEQKAAITSGAGGIGDYKSYLTSGTGALDKGIAAIDSGVDTMGDALGKLPGAETSYQNQADAATLASQQGQAGLGQAQGMTAGADYNFDPTSYQSYMNPYMDDIVQQQYQDIQRLGDVQKQNATSQAVGAGAYGGSRAAVQQAMMDRSTMEQQAKTGSQLRSAGFQQASNLAQQAAANQAQQQLQQAGQYGQQAQAYGNMGLAGATQMGQVGQGLGSLAQLQGQIGQSTGALGQSLGQMGTAYGGLGATGQQMGVQDVNTLMGVGALQQGQDQQALDIARANDLAQQSQPYQQVGFLSDIFQGTPAMNQTYSTTTTPPPSTQSQLYGLGIAGVGAYGMANSGRGTG